MMDPTKTEQTAASPQVGYIYFINIIKRKLQDQTQIFSQMLFAAWNLHRLRQFSVMPRTPYGSLLYNARPDESTDR
jgi:hypothetical protein